MNAAEAGRKGGRSRSPRKLAAARRNGFQPVHKVNTEPHQKGSQVLIVPVVPRKDIDCATTA